MPGFHSFAIGFLAVVFCLQPVFLSFSGVRWGALNNLAAEVPRQTLDSVSIVDARIGKAPRNLATRRPVNSLALNREQRQEHHLGALFGVYRRRSFHSLAAGVEAPQDWKRLHEELEDVYPTWPADWGGAFVLEVAVEAMDDGSAWWLRLIETACERFRAEGPGTPFERSWHLALFAAAERYGHELPVSVPQRSHDVPISIVDHLKHALERFPEDDRLALTSLRIAPGRGVHKWIAERRVQLANPDPGRATRRIQEAVDRRLDEVADDFLALAESATVGHEARIRAGYVYLVGGRPEDALEQLASATDAPEARWRYLAHLLTARAHAAREHDDAAVEAARLAVEALPEADAGRRLLASLLFAAGQQDEAVAIVEALLGRPPREDPWDWFPFGDGYLWPARRDAMREMLR